jgi:WD40 repeat protein
VVTTDLNEPARLWDVTGARALGRPLALPPQKASSLAFSPDGTLLVAVGNTGIQAWDVKTGSVHGPLLGLASVASDVAFMPDGALLVSTADGTISRWNPSTGDVSRLALDGGASVAAFSVSADGRWLAGATEHGISIWDPSTGQSRGQLDAGPNPVIYQVAFSPDSQFLTASGCSDFQNEGHGGCATTLQRWWDTTTWQAHSGTPLEPGLPTFSVALGPAGRPLAFSTGDGAVGLRDLDGDQSVTNLGSDVFTGAQGAAGAITIRTHVAISPDGRYLATNSGATGSSGDTSSGTRLWDAATRLPLGSALAGTGTNEVLAFSPDSKWLASASTLTGAVTLWDVDGASWQARACRIAHRELTQDEWRTLVGGDTAYATACAQ